MTGKRTDDFAVSRKFNLAHGTPRKFPLYSLQAEEIRPVESGIFQLLL